MLVGNRQYKNSYNTSKMWLIPAPPLFFFLIFCPSHCQVFYTLPIYCIEQHVPLEDLLGDFFPTGVTDLWSNSARLALLRFKKKKKFNLTLPQLHLLKKIVNFLKRVLEETASRTYLVDLFDYVPFLSAIKFGSFNLPLPPSSHHWLIDID